MGDERGHGQTTAGERRSASVKTREWLIRYGPPEVVGTVVELGAAAWLYVATGSLAAAAVAGTVGAAVGYYGLAFAATARLAYRQHPAAGRSRRILAATALAARSVVAEFGPGECIDSFAVRPLLYLLAPLALDNAVLGWIVAKIVSDLVFYACVIGSYEFGGGLIVRRATTKIEEPA